MNKFIVITGCSGGGKSSLITALSRQGYAVIEEVGRKIVKEHGDMDPLLRCEMIIERSIEAYHQAEKMGDVKENVIFFDRCFLEGVSYYQALKIHKYDHFIEELRYYSTIFITPPWPEIYCQDNERKHSLEDALEEYNKTLKFYPQYGYHLIQLPKVSVEERVKFMLSSIVTEVPGG